MSVTSGAATLSTLVRELPDGNRLVLLFNEGREDARWTVRLVAIPLLLGSGIPVLGAACAAALVAVSGLAWTAAFEREIARGGLVEGAAESRA